MKNQGLKNHQKSNRLRRIPKRLLDIRSSIIRENHAAEKAKREPVLGELYAQQNRLHNRLGELMAS